MWQGAGRGEEVVREREPLRHSAHTFSLPCASVSYRLDLLVEECICWENSRAQKSCNPPLSPLTLAYNLRGAGHLINSIVTRLHGQSSHHTPIPIAHPQSPQPSTNLSNCTLAIALKKNDRWGRDRCAIFNFCSTLSPTSIYARYPTTPRPCWVFDQRAKRASWTKDRFYHGSR